MAIADVQTAFTAGELSPNVWARVDLAKFDTGAALIRNFVVNFRGGVTRRKGTRFIAGVKNYTSGPQDARLISFVVATEASYVLEFGDSYIRAYLQGTLVDEVVTPYAAADLALLKYAQSADVMTIVHPSYPPANLNRTGTTSFTYVPIVIGPTIDPPVITDVTASNGGDYFYGYLVTSVSLDGKQESLPSNIGVDTSEILDETSNRIIRLRWTPPSQPTSRYNIYKWGPIEKTTEPATIWGFIGSSQTTHFVDNNIAPDFSKEPPGWGDPFSGGQFQSIDVASGGSGYDGSGGWTAIPYVPLDISGDGSGASGWATIEQASGEIVGVYLTTAGKNYTTATITAVGESGTGATFTETFSAPQALNPSTVAYIQQRQVFAGSDLKPETFVMSQPGDYTNFNTTPVSIDSDAISGSLSSLQVNTIKSMVPVAYGLLAFTTGGSFLINGGGPGAAITPSSITAQAQASDGANDMPPLSINYDVLYVQNKGNRVRDLAFAWQRQSYTGSDISALAAHLFDNYQLTEWCWSQEPDKIVWAVRNDGVMLGLTYVPDQEVYAWSRHDTQGEFKSVCAVPEGDANAVYVIVRRFVPDVGDGSCCPGWVDYIERMDTSESDCPLDAWYLDCALPLPTTNGPVDLCLSDLITTSDPPTVIVSPCALTITVLRNAPFDSSPSHGWFPFTVPEGYTSGGFDLVLDTQLTSATHPTRYKLNDAGAVLFNAGDEYFSDIAAGTDDTVVVGTTYSVFTCTPNYFQQVPTARGDLTFAIPGTSTDVSNANPPWGVSDPAWGLDNNSGGGGIIDKNDILAAQGLSPGPAGIGMNIPAVEGVDLTGTPLVPAGASTLDVTLFELEQFAHEGTSLADYNPGPGPLVPGTGTPAGANSFNGGDKLSLWVNQRTAMTSDGNQYIYAVKAVVDGVDHPIPITSMYVMDPITHLPVPVAHNYAADGAPYYPWYLLDIETPLSLDIGQVIKIGCSLLTVTGTTEGGDYECAVRCLEGLEKFLLPNVDGVLKVIPSGEWSYTTPSTTISGLDHLEGMEVWALADGLAQGPFTVASGSITLPYAAAVVVVGLKFTSQLQTLYLTTEGIFQGSDQGKRKQITGMTVRLDNTKALMGGTDFDHLAVFPETIITDPCKAYTGDTRVLTYPAWNTNGQVVCETSEPLPAQVLGIIVEVTPGDTGR